MRIAYLDCFAGIAGDMFLGALVDVGVPRSILQDATSALQLGATLHFETVDRAGVSSTKVQVLVGDRPADAPPIVKEMRDKPSPELDLQQLPPGHAHPHAHAQEPDAPTDTRTHEQGRSLTTIRQLIRNSALADDVMALAIQTFELLGESEARIHNVPLDEIHFHEVGAIDAIIDIVAGAAGALHLNVDAWHSSQVNVGGGFVRCAHGVFPVPAPATADLLRGLPTYSAHVQKELVTPTGAALLRALCASFGPQPYITVDRIGYGAGTRNPADFPNVLRLSLGDSHEDTENMPTAPLADRNASQTSRYGHAAQTVTVIETALDDATPQLLAYVAEKALKLGALDTTLTPVIMKKGRPGSMLTIYCNPEDAAKLEELLLRETTTLGVRVRQDRRICLDRSSVPIETPYGSIRVKVGTLNGEILNANPEFEDCRDAAERCGIPLKRVQAAAMAAYTMQASEGPQP